MKSRTDLQQNWHWFEKEWEKKQLKNTRSNLSVASSPRDFASKLYPSPAKYGGETLGQAAGSLGFFPHWPLFYVRFAEKEILIHRLLHGRFTGVCSQQHLWEVEGRRVIQEKMKCDLGVTKASPDSTASFGAGEWGGECPFGTVPDWGKGPLNCCINQPVHISCPHGTWPQGRGHDSRKGGCLQEDLTVRHHQQVTLLTSWKMSAFRRRKETLCRPR